MIFSENRFPLFRIMLYIVRACLRTSLAIGRKDSALERPTRL
jgi:hypothetical protein